MAIERTLAIIKPDAVFYGYAGRIVSLLAREGFRIVACKEVTLTEVQARTFYDEHSEKSFFIDLALFMTTAPVIALALRREGAVARLRRVMGETDPASATPDSIRGMFGTGPMSNAIHGSDSVESARREISLFFAFIDLHGSEESPE